MNILSAQCIAPVLERGNYDGNGYKYSFRISDIYEEKLYGYKHLLARLYNNIYIPHGDSLLLSALKNVQVTYDEFQKRMDFDSDPSKYSGLDENGYLSTGNYIGEAPHWSWVANDPQYYTDEEKSGVYHAWGDGGIYCAESYKDITIVEQFNGEGPKEYYSTPEIIEVLENWIEALERWNNPEERKKMIAEYEANEQKKIQDFRD